MRSTKEIASRLKQELRNLQLWARPPRLKTSNRAPTRRFKIDPADVAGRLSKAEFAREVVRLADQICQHRFSLLGVTIETGAEIHWRRDYLSGKETGLDYFRLISYLDAAKAGDHKIIWEMNRHQHLVLLTQAFLFTGNERYLSETWAQIESWIAGNPFQRGINWASALEVAIRALSWIWIYELVGDRMTPEFRGRFLTHLFWHGCHLENNLSFYFSPNTHLLGEAVALHAVGNLFPNFPNAGRWEQLGARIVDEQMNRQVRDDGSHFEQSTYYHVYALDMFLFHAVLVEPGPWYRDKLRRMAEYLDALLGPARKLPFLGDDDGGRFFHPFGKHDEFGRASLATCSVLLDHGEWLHSAEDLHPQAVWWLGADVLEREPGRSTRQSRMLPDAGIAVMTAGDRHIVADAGPFGPWGSGHSHSDTLSVVVRAGDDEILIDPGTYAYTGDSAWRDWFRGSIAHNTIRIDGRDQANPTGPFRWNNPPETKIRTWVSDSEQDLLDAECSYSGFTHRRRIQFIKPDLVLIIDDVSGPDGEHDVEQIWHLGSPEARARLVLPEEAQAMEGWQSSAFGEKHAAPAWRVKRRCTLPARFRAALALTNTAKLEFRNGQFHWRPAGESERVIRFE